MNPNRLLTITAIFLLVSFFSCKGHDHEHDHPGEKLHEDSRDHKGHSKKEAHRDHDEHHDDEHKEHHGHGESLPGAVVKADEKKGIQVLPEALRTIGMRKLPLKKFAVAGSRTYRVPREALVRFEMNRGCYLKRGDWFRQEKVSLVKGGRSHAVVHIPGSRRGDELVVAGTPLMRLTWLEAFGASGHGHGH